MENHIYLSAFIAIAVFLICNKWSELSKNVCMFCTIGWIALIIFGVIFGMGIYDHLHTLNEQLETIELVNCAKDFFKNSFFVWATTSIFYFFVKHNFE
jgi:CDP-diglyceride synthetase